jgi:hypothetical protein
MVFNSLNGILADIGRPERFFEPYTGDQIVCVTFVRSDEFLAAACDLRIPLEIDPEAPRRAGMAYTRYVLSRAGAG